MPLAQPILATAAGDWTFEVSGLVMGYGTPYMVTSIEGLRERQPRSQYANRPLGHGSLPVPDYLGSKQIVLGMTLPNPAAAVEADPGVTAVRVPTWVPLTGVGYTGLVEYKIENDGLVRLRGTATTTVNGTSHSPPGTGAIITIPIEARPLIEVVPLYFDYEGLATSVAALILTNTMEFGIVAPAGSVINLGNVRWQGTAPSPVVVIPSNRLESLLDALEAAWAPVLDGVTLKTLSWQLPGVSKKRLYGRARNLSVDMSTYDLGWVDVMVEFLATDPIAYSDTESSSYIALGDPGVGRTYSRIYPMAYGGGTSGTSNLVNAGNETAWPIITFTGPITNPSADNTTLGKKIKFGITLVAGDTLVVDTAARTVVLNGTASRYHTLTSSADQWWGLAPGGNSVRYAADNYVSGSIMNVKWRSAWR